MPCSLFYGFNAFVYWSAVASSKVSASAPALAQASTGLRRRAGRMRQDMAGHVGLGERDSPALLLLTCDKKARIVWPLALSPVSCPADPLPRQLTRLTN